MYWKKYKNGDSIIYIIETGEDNEKLKSIKLYAMYDELLNLTDQEHPEPVNENDEAVLEHWIGNDNPLIGGPKFEIIDNE